MFVGDKMHRWCADKSIINRIMLRFRPIAPKPETGADVPGGSPVDSRKNLCVPKGRAKRKYVRVRRDSGCERKKTIAREGRKDGVDKRVATLQLLPEKSDLELSRDVGSRRCDENELDPAAADKNRTEGSLGPLMVLNDNKAASNDTKKSDRKVVEAWVTVEYVTGTCMDGMVGFGSTDVERIRNLEGDTCPGFVSDGMNRVEWVNGAFKRMIVKVRGGHEVEEEEGQSWETRVWLVIKEKLPNSYHSSFSCHVKVQYWWGKDRYSQMMPCDVCKMDGGGFAWRLDVEAALTLGR